MSLIDDYLKKVNQPERSELERVRKIIQETAPEATEVITYGMPGYKYKGKYLISFAAFKDHLSIFPGSHVVEVLKDKLEDYETSKGTVQFTLEKPLPEGLIKEVVQIRLDDISKS